MKTEHNYLIRLSTLFKQFQKESVVCFVMFVFYGCLLFIIHITIFKENTIDAFGNIRNIKMNTSRYLKAIWNDRETQSRS